MLETIHQSLPKGLDNHKVLLLEHHQELHSTQVLEKQPTLKEAHHSERKVQIRNLLDLLDTKTNRSIQEQPHSKLEFKNTTLLDLL